MPPRHLITSVLGAIGRSCASRIPECVELHCTYCNALNRDVGDMHCAHVLKNASLTCEQSQPVPQVAMSKIFNVEIVGMDGNACSNVSRLIYSVKGGIADI
jgi:hypothetical protein